jgi:hypothetical protein
MVIRDGRACSDRWFARHGGVIRLPAQAATSALVSSSFRLRNGSRDRSTSLLSATQMIKRQVDARDRNFMHGRAVLVDIEPQIAGC